MPQVRYTVTCGGDEFREIVLFKRGDAASLVVDEIIIPMNKKRGKLGEPLWLLKGVEVLNPHVHLHEWSRTHINRSTLRSIYVCRHCEVMGYIPYNIVTGETGKNVYRDEAYKKDKYAECHDKLKEAPKKLSFN